MNLQEILGESYTEGMSIDDINKALSNMKLVDLSSGNYVDKHKYENEVSKLKNTINEKNVELQNRMTEDEKKENADKEAQKRFDDLQKAFQEQGQELNKIRITTHTREIQSLLGIKDDDAEYNEFVNIMSQKKTEDVNKIASYFAKIAKNAYEKGKKESIRKGLGDMGDQDGDSSKKADNNLGTDLAKAVVSKNNSNFSYFGKYK